MSVNKPDAYCKGCEYSRTLNHFDGARACLYILEEGKRRPCPPGKDCTVRKGSAAPGQARPEPDLAGRCGSCAYAIPKGGNKYWVECTHPDRIAKQYRSQRESTIGRQRTAFACKKYKERENER